MNPEYVDQAVAAWYSATEKWVGVQPRGTFERHERGVNLIIMGGKLSIANGVSSAARQADADAVAATAQIAARAGVPWSIQVRDDSPSADIAGIAAAHGLKDRTERPFMLKRLDRPPAAANGDKAAAVRVASLDDSATYIAVLSAGFGGAATLPESFGSPAFLGIPSFTGYLAEADGVPVATGLAALEGDWVCIYNIATLPDYRRRGYGRAIMDRLLRDAYAAGARHALLHSSASGLDLYSGMDFRTAERWTVFMDAGGWPSV